MSHRRHDRKDEKRRIDLRLYARILRFTWKYWPRLFVGIFCGMLVGGSLFFALMMIPQMASVVETPLGSARPAPRAAEKVTGTGDPQLDKLLGQVRDYSRRFSLPIEVHGAEIRITAPVEFTFRASSPEGRIAWQIFALYGVGFVLVWAAKTTGEYLNKYFMNWVGHRVVADMRAHIFDRLLAQSLRFYGKRSAWQKIRDANKATVTTDGRIQAGQTLVLP